MSWLIPYNKLDKDQLSFIEDFRKNENNCFIRGFAGCGKSVLLIHALLAEKEKNPDAKIIIVTYTHALIDMIKLGIPEDYKDIQVVTYIQFRNMLGKWDLVLVDEVQDLDEDILKEIEPKSKRVILAGDKNQSIYDGRVNIDNIKDIISTNNFDLTIIHRISKIIRRVAQFFCRDKSDFSSAQMGRVVDLKPKLIEADNYEEEFKCILLMAKEYAKQGYAPVILLPKHREIDSFFEKLLHIEGKPSLPDSIKDRKEDRRNNANIINSHLSSNGLNFQYLGNGAGSYEKGLKDNKVTVMTYHSAKGLDFEIVFVPFLSQSLEIWRDDDIRARTLFFVALTRSREQLILSYSNTKHRFLDEIPMDAVNAIKAKTEINRQERVVNLDDDEPIFVF